MDIEGMEPNFIYTVMAKLEWNLHILLYIINKSFFTLLPIKVDKHRPMN